MCLKIQTHYVQKFTYVDRDVILEGKKTLQMNLYKEFFLSYMIMMKTLGILILVQTSSSRSS